MQELLSGLIETIQDALLDAIQGVVRHVLRRVALVLLGTILASFGIICLLMGLLKILTLVMQEWTAWTIMGTLAMLLGILTVIASVPRKRR